MHSWQNALVIGKTAASKTKTLEKRQDIIELMDNGYVEMERLFNEVRILKIAPNPKWCIYMN